MSYVIREEGYEVRGYKLGQSVVYEDDKTEHVIIGFSEDDADCFIAISHQNGAEMRTSMYVSVILDGSECDRYVWEKPEYLSVVKSNPSDDQLLQDISSTHALEILEDIIKDEFVHEYFFGNDEGKLFSCYTQEQMNVIKQCIEILKAK